ncbi:hypothetical protein FHS83_001935 [Rhizomicrobium palustre]|uniref:YCII-related domain-containing protein n=1 Tax=Rhizomicrobium palustre TaxID=189966 RepID=A0A846N0B2_9PROT|nr:YciI family protein [Rhizomicrobium palustre]NIK88617.1 hypothetical protein [Rhizomicrobium palustre]
MLFVVTAIDKKDSLDLRLATREAHFAFARDTGRIKLGGPFLNAKGEMAGSMMVIEAPDLETAEAWHMEDPYVKAGLFESSDIRPWKPALNAVGADFGGV